MSASSSHVDVCAADDFYFISVFLSAAFLASTFVGSHFLPPSPMRHLFYLKSSAGVSVNFGTNWFNPRWLDVDILFRYLILIHVVIISYVWSVGGAGCFPSLLAAGAAAWRL